MINVEQRERVVHMMIDAPPVNVLDAAILGELVLGQLDDDGRLPVFDLVADPNFLGQGHDQIRFAGEPAVI